MAYPLVTDDNFYSRINNKYKKFKIEKKKKTFKQICYPKEYELQIPQKFVSNFIAPNTPYKDLLIFHRIGAGKTCAAVSIAEQWKDERHIIFVVPASLVGNVRTELRSPCAKNAYITDNERAKLAKYHPSSREYKDIIKKSDERIDKNYSIYSYNKMISLIENKKLSLKNKVLIIDEIQNVVSETGKYYKLIYDAIHDAPENLRVILMSATPIFDKPVEIALTMNLLRLPNKIPVGRQFTEQFIANSNTGLNTRGKNIELFKKYIKGFVSYYRGSPPYVFPESKIKFVRCNMNDFQYKCYLSVLKNDKNIKENLKNMEAFHSGTILDLPKNFFLGARMISNIAFPNKNINQDGFESFSDKAIEELEKYSVKITKIIRKVKTSPGPVFIYSNFKEYGGIKTLARALDANGFRNYLKDGEGKKRYAIWSGDSPYNIKEEIKAVFNLKDNYLGEKLKIILGTPSTKEGISFFNVRQVHILEPYWNYSRILQIIGRAVRYCSHKQLDEEDRNVMVYIYLATHPNVKLTIDEYITKIALHKNKVTSEFEQALKEAAVDCELFKNGNSYPDEKEIKCYTK